jgi:hypothetical protein
MPAPQTYTVSYSTDNGASWTAFTNVQQIDARIGRARLMDSFEPSSMSFTMRYPSGFYSPNTALVTGTLVKLERTGSAYQMWQGRIADVSVDYGIPYAGNVGVSDYVTVSCEGSMAIWGRLAGNNLLISANPVRAAISQALSGTNIQYATTYTATDDPPIEASNISGSYLEWINLVATTLSSTLKDGGELVDVIGLYTKDFVGTLPVAFSDTANNSTNQVYNQVKLTSQVENYFTNVVVTTQFNGTANVTTGSAPYRTLPLTTINASNAQATDLANYYLGNYNTPRTTITEITASSEAQSSWALDLGYGWWDIIGYRTNVTFRGATYYMTILGSSFTATPSGSMFTYQLADASLSPFFVLDDPVYGILDTNKLSW